jgi:hypothetical protein
MRAVGAGATTAGAVVWAGGGVTFFLQLVTATKATSNTTGIRIRLRRSNGLLLLQKHEHFPDALTFSQHPASVAQLAATRLQATMVPASVIHEKAVVEAGTHSLRG